MSTPRTAVVLRTAGPRTAGPRSADPQALRPVDHDRFRSRTAVSAGCSRLGDAVRAFDHLVVAARDHELTETPHVRAAFVSAVEAIARAVRPDGRRLADVAGSGANAGWVLVDRAAARFSSRIVGTELANRPCPPAVIAALGDARRALAAAGATVDVGTLRTASTTIVVAPARRSSATLERIASAARRAGAATIHVLGVPEAVRSPELASMLAIEFGTTSARRAGSERLSERHVAALVGGLRDRGLPAAGRTVPARLLRDELDDLVAAGGTVTVVSVRPRRLLALRSRLLERRARRLGARVVLP